MPCGDVSGCVHVCVAGVSTGSTSKDRLALAILTCNVPARRAPLAGVGGVDLLDPAASFLFQPLDQDPPAGGKNSRFSPALARTLRPGASTVPFADRVIFCICRSSTRIKS